MIPKRYSKALTSEIWGLFLTLAAVPYDTLFTFKNAKSFVRQFQLRYLQAQASRFTSKATAKGKQAVLVLWNKWVNPHLRV